MRFFFNPKENLILVRARIVGPSRFLYVSLALDTASTLTLLSNQVLRALGLDLSEPERKVRITTGSRAEVGSIMTVDEFESLGSIRKNFQVVCHDLPPRAGVDGVLGLDFLRGHRLTLDLREGFLSLE